VLLLGIRHRQQRRKADCLVACAAMVLDYLDVAVDETRLRRRLGTTDNGTPFPNLERLQALGLFVHSAKHGDLSIFEHYLELGLPVIVSVETFGWRHWAGEVTRHAVVVVGIDQANGVSYVHDPFFADAPIEMDLTEFMIGWEERERQYAVIGLAPPEAEVLA
jgi:ABC-type bacteriocin/lantibiotic exporter with double-glycine peptidase domain